MNAIIVPMCDRKHRTIPLDKITVINSRDRDKQQFAENVRSIDEVGQRKPIMVNSRYLEKTGLYELVCGEGRLLAHQRLGKTEIVAEVVDCDRKRALLFSLVENIARVPPGTMWFAREMKRMHDAGLSCMEIGTIVGKHHTYVSDYVKLVEQGEQRLIEGVERGLFTMSFAVHVAQSDDPTIQNLLMDAFDEQIVNAPSVPRVRKLLELRLNRGKSPHARPRGEIAKYTIKDLTQDIAKLTKEKEDYVRETTRKENRLLGLLMGTSTLLADADFWALLKTIDLALPQLSGKYGIELPKSPIGVLA